MKKITILLFLIFYLTATRIYAQGATAVPFLLIQPSPHLNGMAGAYSALATSDPFGQYFNPAQLAYFGKKNNIAFQFFTRRTPFQSSIIKNNEVFLVSSAFSAGFTSDKIIPGIPVSIGVGYLYTKLDYGTNIWTDENGNVLSTFDSKENYNQFGIGWGIDLPLKLNIGFAIKKINSNLVNVDISNWGPSNEKAVSVDYGVLITAPILNLIGSLGKKKILASENFTPFFDVNLGFAMQNIGKGIKYINKSQDQPLPRQANLGYGLSCGFNTKILNIEFQLMKASWASEARNLLVHSNADGTWEYVTFPGKIKIIDNILLGKNSKQIGTYQGWSVTLLETFEYSYGYYKKEYFLPYTKTHGLWISSLGMAKLLSHLVKNELLSKILSKIEIDYAQTEYSVRRDHPYGFNSFKGINIVVRNLF